MVRSRWRRAMRRQHSAGRRRQAVQEVRCKDSQSPRNQARYRNARVAKLVDARDLKSLSRKAMRVRPPPRARIYEVIESAHAHSSSRRATLARMMSMPSHSHRAANVVVTWPRIAFSISAYTRHRVAPRFPTRSVTRMCPKHPSTWACTGTGIRYRTPQRHCS